MRPKSVAVRLVLGAGLWIAAALVAGGLALSSLFRDSVERSFDARLVVLLESLVAASEVSADGGLILTRAIGEPRFEQVYSGWYWQIDGVGALPLRSRSLWDQLLLPPPTAEATAIADSEALQREAQGPDGQRLRLTTRDILLPGRSTAVRFAVGAERDELDQEIGKFDRTLFWALGALGIGLLAAVFIQVRFGLQPLRRVGTALAAVRTGQTTRLEGEFPTEIRPLSDELNMLLAHNAAVVERARTHVSNLAHGLKTPLSVLTNEADAAPPGPLADAVRRQTTVMRRHVDHYLSRARAAASGQVLGARTEVMPVVEDLRRARGRIHAERGLALEVAGDAGAAFRGERQDLEEMLGNLIDNACKWAHSRVRVSAAVQGARLRLTIEDDGKGLAEAERETVFQRGLRLDEAVPGSGLGLAIVRDIADLYGGGVTLGRAALGGLEAVLDLPAAPG
jgi:signal transduction histidine kinase